MNRQMTAKLAPGAGVVFVVLTLVAYFSLPSDFLDDPQSIADKFADSEGRFLGSAQMAVIAAAALLWFCGAIASAIGANGGGARLASTARAGGTAGAALILASATMIASGALRAGEDGSIDPASAAVTLDLAMVLAAGAAPVAFAVLVAATAAGSLRGNRFLPYGLDWASIVLAIALLILPINFIAVLVFLVWVLIVAGLMIAGRLAFEPSPEGAGSD